MPSSTNDMNALEMPPAEGIHGSLQQDMANGADSNKEFLSVPDASAHEEKKQLEQPAEKEKCMGVSKAGRQCIQFALPGCERCRRHAKQSGLTDDNVSEAVPASGTKTQVAEHILHARTAPPEAQEDEVNRYRASLKKEKLQIVAD